MKNQDILPGLIRLNLFYSTLNTKIITRLIHKESTQAFQKSTERMINKSKLNFNLLNSTKLKDEHGRPAKQIILKQLLAEGRKKRKLILYIQLLNINGQEDIIALNDSRGGRRWIICNQKDDKLKSIELALTELAQFEKKNIILIPSGKLVTFMRKIVRKHNDSNFFVENHFSIKISLEIYSHGLEEILQTFNPSNRLITNNGMTHLKRLEAESIHIIREVMADAQNPVMLYSIGKDSSVMVHLARKAFYPSPPPFPLLHIDTLWKFQAMYDFRNFVADDTGMELIVFSNPEGTQNNINPFVHGSTIHTDIMKTQALKMALDKYKFDVAFGGARRDEEKSRAKERIFSFRTASHQWDPKNQRPELWNLYNGKKKPGETIRVFPISNWTELDIWEYIYSEQIPIVPLYFASERPTILRNNMLIMVDDDRLELYPNEKIEIKKIRFRTLGCYPLTGAFESEANDLSSIVLELIGTRTSERQGRAIDSDVASSMERKKNEGYF